jgi:hypothetical protein
VTRANDIKYQSLLHNQFIIGSHHAGVKDIDNLGSILSQFYKLLERFFHLLTKQAMDVVNFQL